MYLFSFDSYAPLAAGADAGQYLRPARSLVDYGEFTMNPPGWTPEMGESRPFTFGTPLYSILLAIPYYFFGQNEIFYAAVIRKDLDGYYGEGWHLEQAVSREEALKMFTLWPAYAAFQEDVKGSLEVGKLADLTILSKDIMQIPEDEILTAEAVMTVVNGDIVFERK